MTRYVLTDAPGHHGDWLTVYSTHRTEASARKALGSSQTCMVIVDPYDQYTKGDRIPRVDIAAHMADAIRA